MIQRVFLLVILGVFLLVHCGRKELPPSPDRWKPKVREVVAVDRNHLEILFSEEMEKGSAEAIENYQVTLLEGESLSVISALMKKDGKSVQLTTEPQGDKEYLIEITGVLDVAGNEVKRGRKRFRGSTTRDGISPTLLTLTPTSGMTKVSPDTSLVLTFSESMDTSAVGEAIIILPPRALVLDWSPSLSEVQIRDEEGFQEGFVYRVYVTGGCRDIAGNPLRNSRSTHFTVDVSLPKGSVTGRVVLEEPKGTLIGLLNFAGAYSDTTLLLLLEIIQEKEGGFRLTPLLGGTYLLVGWKEEENLIYSGTYGPFDLKEEEPIEGIPLSLEPDGKESPASILKKFYPLMRSSAD
ncbi:Ig-like domain-containing protein [candidate division TA06 bacterium]|nr:Ig-like domain-containing protein [candidate division TA06 bacterium]